MAILKDISNSIFGWISPQKTHANRGPTQGVPQDPAAIAIAKRKARAGAKQLATGTVSHHRRSRNSGTIPWEYAQPSSPTVYGSIEEQLAATALEDEEMEDAGDEGAIDTMSDEDDSGLLDEDGDGSTAGSEEASSIAKKSSVRMHDSKASIVIKSEKESDGEDDDDDEAIPDANQDLEGADVVEATDPTDEEAEQERLEEERRAKAEEQRIVAMDLLSKGWSQETIGLYLLIDRRTIEPLLPSRWIPDFPLFPPCIWTDDYSQAFLGGTRPDQDNIMVKALEKLLKLPAHVRNQIRIKAWHGRRAEAMVVKYCEDFMKLIHKDCNVFIPLKKRKLWSLVCYAPGDDKLQTDELEELILTRLRKRASKVLDSLRVEAWKDRSSGRRRDDFFWHEKQAYLVEPPTLYGIVSKKAVIALVAYEPLSPRDALRTIAFFHLSKSAHDVWNALALAIVMIQCRNRLLQIKEAIPEDLDALELSDSDEDA